ncbi:hypothetical protein BSZ39_01085 [Bowdeniella nasicola]|uniref:MobA-like NTP transferase domain-containing protein n=1 Tax=Bowdeniella nasicola TaxID=208480 RepID=A0A1Q5Q5A5_9ACTO|nr:NTP transferase domain-containing protein [Bowdeniella nasicola]OKL55004.1 hypothetical protein BSZ39_01085 [Bowdeniella nasicola]
MSSLHVLILGGGTARRLGGVSKPDVTYQGRRLLDHALASLPDAVTGRRVVVAPETVAVPGDVLRTLEDPPFGGPVAGIAAGLAALAPKDDDLVAILTCDAPRAGEAVPTLLAALTDADCAIGRDANGREQYLLGVYRVAALTARIEQWGRDDLAGAPVWKFISALRAIVVDMPAELTHDIDTPDDLTAH